MGGFGMFTLLTRIDRDEGMNRWYMVTIQPTLFDPIAVVCAWGSRQNDYQQMRIMPVESVEEGVALAEKIVRNKERRGYQVRVTNQ
jgi:predicted DNA-binding WGR domain protein